MGMLFGRGSTEERIKWAGKMAFSHGLFLSLLVSSYKVVQCLLVRILKTNSKLLSLVAAFVSARVVLAKKWTLQMESIMRQYTYYIVPRVIEAVFVHLKKRNGVNNFEGFPITYIIVWGRVMFLFELDKSLLNRSIVSSMDFIYKDSD